MWSVVSVAQKCCFADVLGGGMVVVGGRHHGHHVGLRQWGVGVVVVVVVVAVWQCWKVGVGQQWW